MFSSKNKTYLTSVSKRALAALVCGSGFFGFSAIAQDVGVGSFERRPFQIDVGVTQGWDSNVNTTKTDKQDSAFTRGQITLSTAIGRPRTQLKAALTGGYNYYWETVQNRDDDYFGSLNLSLNHRVSPRLSLSLSTHNSYQIEPDFYDSIGRSRRSGHYFYSNSTFAATYQITNKLSSVTSYSFVAVDYKDNAVSQIEDRTEQYISQQFRYLILPTTVLVGEYRFSIIDYDYNSYRDSTGHYALVGVDHNFSPRLQVSLRGGAEFRDYDRGGNATNPYGEATVRYNYTKDSTVSWVTRYGSENSDIVGVGSENTTLRTGLRVNHRLTGKTYLNFGAYYQHSEYQRNTGDFNDDLIDLTAGVNYQATKNLNLYLGYSYTTILSDLDYREYDRHRIYVGAGYSF